MIINSLLDTRTCTNCYKEKELSEFSKDKSRKDNLNIYCKECNKRYRDNNIEKRKKYQKMYKKQYPWKSIFNSIKQRCENPNNTFYKYYGEKGIKNFLKLKDIEYLWYRDKAYNMKKPSIDRKKSNQHYDLDNCEFIEQSENSAKDKRKIILQYSLDGKFIREWNGVMTVEKELSIHHSNIIKCINGERNHSGGFKWKYKELL